MWHYRLGHPNFLYLEKCFPSFFNNKSPKFFQSEKFQFSKHVRNPYPNKPYKVSCHLSMINSDVWGPSQIKNITRTQRFISFVDDHARITSLFLMKEKSKLVKYLKISII